MSKSALVIPAHQRFYAIDQWTPSMMSRDVCETDPTHLQVLPYVVLVSEDDEIYMYTRGAAGAESRLHAKRSVGLGGHIDSLPVGMTLREHIAHEAIREVEEECGYKPALKEMLMSLDSHTRLYSTESDVDSVHLGLVIMLNVLKKDIVKPEEGTIVDPRWMLTEELQAYSFLERLVKPQCMLWSLENWSKQVVQALTVRGHAEKMQATDVALSERYGFYHNVVSAMNTMGIQARVNTVKGLRIEVPLWETEEKMGEGYVSWSMENMDNWTRIDVYVEGFVFSDGNVDADVLLTPDFVRWELRSRSTLHPIPDAEQLADELESDLGRGLTTSTVHVDESPLQPNTAA